MWSFESDVHALNIVFILPSCQCLELFVNLTLPLPSEHEVETGASAMLGTVVSLGTITGK